LSGLFTADLHTILQLLGKDLVGNTIIQKKDLTNRIIEVFDGYGGRRFTSQASEIYKKLQKCGFPKLCKDFLYGEWNDVLDDFKETSHLVRFILLLNSPMSELKEFLTTYLGWQFNEDDPLLNKYIGKELADQLIAPDENSARG
jgi:hypothetical protein